MDYFDKKYQAEIKNKWENTKAYSEYTEKTKNYSDNKWQNLNENMNDILVEFANYLKEEEAPDSSLVQNLVKKLQDYITLNYYNCSDEILKNLGQMYVSDERFKNNIDKNGNGTAKFISDAIEIYCSKA